MSLTRDALRQGFMRKAWQATGQCVETHTDEELTAAADAMLEQAGPGDPWVFAYGSLIWNPLIHHAERRCATLRGYHRRFCLWSTVGRGTPERPGLVLGLENGGCCRGVAFRVDRALAREEFRLLWQREMLAGAYAPRWVRVKTAKGDVRAVTFVINRSHGQYAGRLSIDEIVEVMNCARGMIGTSREYLRQTLEGLKQHGIHDPALSAIEARAASLQANPAANLLVQE
jgi:cation transport protein ChaC